MTSPTLISFHVVSLQAKSGPRSFLAGVLFSALSFYCLFQSSNASFTIDTKTTTARGKDWTDVPPVIEMSGYICAKLIRRKYKLAAFEN